MLMFPSKYSKKLCNNKLYFYSKSIQPQLIKQLIIKFLVIVSFIVLEVLDWIVCEYSL